MAVCLLGVLSTSSCSKEEFFGLEDSVYLDNSIKTEIAMSQEFADYILACRNLVNEMKMGQSLDTTDMQIQGIVDGRPLYFKTGSYEAGKNLLEKLKKAYPELEKADQVDFDEIQKIAFSKNKDLKGLASPKISKTKSWGGEAGALGWLMDLSNGEIDDYGQEYMFDDFTGRWIFEAHNTVAGAVSKVIYYCGEEGFNMNGGGYLCSGRIGSAISMIGFGQKWPNIMRPEEDFLAAPNIDLSALELWDIAWRLGPGYYGPGRIHYIFNEEMDYVTFFY